MLVSLNNKTLAKLNIFCLGRVVDYFESVTLRLSNNSVVQIDDADVFEQPESGEAAEIMVGDFLITKKHYIRNGRFIYGEYDPNIAPSGYVAKVSIQSVEIDWLGGTPNDLPPPLPASLEGNELDEIFIYGVSNQTRVKRLKCRDMEVSAGFKIRIRDAGSLSDDQRSLLHRISRQDSLGFDINVYTVISTFTFVTVHWQDNEITSHPSIALAPTVRLAAQTVNQIQNYFADKRT